MCACTCLDAWGGGGGSFATFDLSVSSWDSGTTAALQGYDMTNKGFTATIAGSSSAKRMGLYSVTVGTKMLLIGGVAVAGTTYQIMSDTFLLYTGLYSAFVDPDAGLDSLCALNDAVPCQSLRMALAQYVANERIINALYSNSQLSSVIVVNSQASTNAGVIPLTVPYSVQDFYYMIRGYYTLSPLIPPAKISCAPITAATALQLLVDTSQTSRYVAVSNTVTPACLTHTTSSSGSSAVYLTGVTLLGSTGGALSVTGSTLYVTSSSFINNTGPYGGAIYFQAAKAYLTSSQFLFNSADSSLVSAQTDYTKPLLGAGGALYGLFSTVTLIAVTISNNTATFYGGGAYLDRCYVYNCQSSSSCLSIVSLNWAGLRGGGMYFTFTQGAFSYLNVLNNSVTSIYGQPNGGAGVYQTLGVMTYTYVNFVGNFMVQNSADGTKVDRPESKAVDLLPGGCGLRARVDAYITMTSCTFTDNFCYGHGAGVFADEISLTLSNSSFMRNVAYASCPSACDCANTKTSSPSATSSGGAIFAYAATVALTGNTITYNTAWRGAGVYVFTSGTTSFVASFVVNNTALDGGGGIFWTDNQPSFGSGYMNFSTNVFTPGLTPYLWGNNALYGSNIATWLYGMQIVSQPTAVWSGYLVSSPFVVKLVDYYNTTVTSDTTTQVSVGVSLSFGTQTSAGVPSTKQACNSIVGTCCSQPGYSSGMSNQPACLGCTCTNAQALISVSGVSSVTSVVPSTSYSYLQTCRLGGVATLNNFKLMAYPSATVQLQFTPILNTARKVVNSDPVTLVSTLSCVNGTYMNAQLSCVPCAPGSISNFSNALACVKSPAGYSASGVLTPGLKNSFGQYSPDTGTTTFSVCTPGTFSSARGTPVCNPAAAGSGGSYAPYTGMTSPIPCPPNSGAFPSPSALVAGPTYCQCLSGYYIDVSANSLTCVSCPVGGNCSVTGVTRATLAPLPGCV